MLSAFSKDFTCFLQKSVAGGGGAGIIRQNFIYMELFTIRARIFGLKFFVNVQGSFV
jgi:hypothetical protein